MSAGRRERLSAVGLLVLRIGAGGMLLGGHGLSKLLHFSGMVGSFPDPLHVGAATSLGLAMFAELLCSALVVIGLATRLATIPVLVTMSVAALLVHGGAPFAKKELALIYALPFLTILLTGPGPLSLDRWFAGWRKGRAG